MTICVMLEPAGTRLGNWMFQYAAAKSAYPDANFCFCCSGGKHLDEPERYSELWPNVAMVTAPPIGSIEFHGLHQDVAELNEGVVQKIYSCPKRVRNIINNKYSAILQKGAVGISVRRGDYLKLPHRHPFVGKKFLSDAVMRFANNGYKTFVVCSDDIGWCKRFFMKKRFSKYEFCYIEGEDVLTQLFVHTFCEHNIVSNSTFSWWGAFLNSNMSKRVIMPSLWFGLSMQTSFPVELVFRGCEIIKNRYSFLTYVYALVMHNRSRLGRLIRSKFRWLWI